MKPNIPLSVILIFFSVLSSKASDIEEVKSLFLSQQYSQALSLIDEDLSKKAKDPILNLWKGKCLYGLNRLAESQKFLEAANQRGYTDAAIYLAKIRFNNYDFTGALEILNKHESFLRKIKKEIPQNLTDEISKVKTAKAMISHVQKIVVLDSINVEKDSFFKYYKLSADCGTLQRYRDQNEEDSELSTIYTTQNKERMIWASPDGSGCMRLMERTKLTDGSWDEPSQFAKEIAGSSDDNYPFIMPDGATMYFASKREDSFGGYDIYISRKDTDSGEYLQPQNIGMPFNSPFDDYLLVIDEMSGFGWWATDRNQIPEKLTVYVYQLPEIRENYAENEANLNILASLKDYRLTWQGADYGKIVEKIRAITSEQVKDVSEFQFIISPGVTYTKQSDFKDSNALSQMQILLKTYNLQKNDMTKLDSLYSKYAFIENSTDKKTIGGSIVQLEKQIERRRVEIYNAENYIRRAENKVRK